MRMPSAIVGPGVTATASGFAGTERPGERRARGALDADETREPIDQPGRPEAR